MLSVNGASARFLWFYQDTYPAWEAIIHLVTSTIGRVFRGCTNNYGLYDSGMSMVERMPVKGSLNLSLRTNRSGADSARKPDG